MVSLEIASRREVEEFVHAVRSSPDIVEGWNGWIEVFVRGIGRHV
jgi:hypothetical protein